MDIYKYLNSRDVEKHCRQLNWRFNALEMAFIINDCKTLPLCEKHRLYAEIMDNKPDVSLSKHFQQIGCEASFFETLRVYIDKEKQLLNKIKNGGKDKVYTYVFHNENDDVYFESRELYTDYKTAVIKMYKDINAWLEDKPDLKYYGTVIMHTLCKPSTCDVLFDQNGNIISISGNFNAECDDLFELFWIYIPVPFKKGDILVTADKSQLRRHRMVLKSVCYWNYPEEKHAHRRERGDSSDMTAYGYWVDESAHLYDECLHDYHNLEYYTGEINGNDRVLKAVSACIKDEIDIAMLLIAYEAVLNEITMKNTFPRWDYLKECYQNAGIGDIFEKRELIKNYERKKYGTNHFIY